MKWTNRKPTLHFFSLILCYHSLAELQNKKVTDPDLKRCEIIDSLICSLSLTCSSSCVYYCTILITKGLFDHSLALCLLFLFFTLIYMFIIYLCIIYFYERSKKNKIKSITEVLRLNVTGYAVHCMNKSSRWTQNRFYNIILYIIHKKKQNYQIYLPCQPLEDAAESQ